MNLEKRNRLRGCFHRWCAAERHYAPKNAGDEAFTFLCSDGESIGLLKFQDLKGYKNSEVDMDGSIKECVSVVRLFEEFARRLRQLKGGVYLVDKVALGRYLMKFILKFLPRSKFLHVVRDGTDRYCSALKHSSIKQASSLDRYSRYWNYNIKTVEELIPRDRLLCVRY